MILAVSHLPLDIAWAILKADGLVLARRLGLSQLQVLLDDALWLCVVHETCYRTSSLPAVLAVSEELPLQALDVGTLSR